MFILKVTRVFAVTVAPGESEPMVTEAANVNAGTKLIIRTSNPAALRKIFIRWSYSTISTRMC